MPDTISDRLATYLNDAANPVKVRLFKNVLAANLEAVAVADLTECDFPGYEPIVANDFEPVDGPAEDVGECLPSERSFVAADTIATPQVVHGVFVTRHPAGNPVELYAVKVFDPPIVVVAPGQEITWVPRVTGEGF